MDRARLKEFRQVRWGAVKLHWTGKDMAEYEEWLGKRFIVGRGAGAPDWLVAIAIILVLTAILIPVVRHVREEAQRAAELNAEQSHVMDGGEPIKPDTNLMR